MVSNDHSYLAPPPIVSDRKSHLLLLQVADGGDKGLKYDDASKNTGLDAISVKAALGTLQKENLVKITSQIEKQQNSGEKSVDYITATNDGLFIAKGWDYSNRAFWETVAKQRPKIEGIKDAQMLSGYIFSKEILQSIGTVQEYVEYDDLRKKLSLDEVTFYYSLELLTQNHLIDVSIPSIDQLPPDYKAAHAPLRLKLSTQGKEILEAWQEAKVSIS